MKHVKLKWLVSASNAGEVIDKSYWGDGDESLYTCARDILRSDFSAFPKWKRTTADDLLLTRNGTPYVHIPVEGAIYSNVVQRISVPKVDKYYLRYALEDRVRSFRGYGVSIESLNYEMWSNLEVALPDLPTQRAIAEFLDRETARIDLLIEKKQRLVALLGEKHSVELACLALGLAPNAVFDKDNWDQHLPSNWVSTSLKNLINPNRQITYGIVQPGERDENGILMVRGQDYSKGWAQPETVFRVSPEIERPYARARLRAGDIVMTIVGAGVGNVALVPTIYNRANITQTTARLAINSKMASGEYVKGVLESKIGFLNVERFKRGAAQPGLMLKDVARFRVPVPPLEDQKKIASNMKTSAERLLNIQTRISTTIDRLKEYRSALITAAVTGQIDVSTYSKSGAVDRRLDAIQEEMGA